MLLPSLLSSLFLLAGAATASETVHGAVLFTRHGDRSPKVQGNTQLSVLGQTQLFSTGSFFQDRYLKPSETQIFGISAVTYDPSQIDAETPDSAVLVTSAQAFLQGLYPPTDFANQTLANGTKVTAPIQGFQYVQLETINDDAPETIALTGDDNCPAYTAAGNNYYTTEEFNTTSAATKDFYAALYEPVLKGIFNQSQASYKNAYQIFDYINFNVVHNETVAKAVNDTTLFQLRTLADRHEWNLNYGANVSSAAPDTRSIGGQTLAGTILGELSGMVQNHGQKEKLATYFGSYDSFVGFFGLADLPTANPEFFGLPDYASSLAFELVSYNTSAFPTDLSQLWVRTLWKNGTDGSMDVVNIFPGTARADDVPEPSVLPWATFSDQMNGIALQDLENWCGLCGSSASFCEPGIVVIGQGMNGTANGAGGGGISKAAAGGVGAACALAVCGLVAVGFALFRRRRNLRRSRTGTAEEGVAIVTATSDPEKRRIPSEHSSVAAS